jgi:hypothetical protein
MREKASATGPLSRTYAFDAAVDSLAELSHEVDPERTVRTSAQVRPMGHAARKDVIDGAS